MFILIQLGLVAAIVHMPIRRHQSSIEYPVIDDHQTNYVLDMHFGSNKVPLSLTIDTGSADLWVPAANSHGFGFNIKKYDCDKSETCKKTHDKYEIYYDDGPVSGVLAWDQVWLGDLKFNTSFVLMERADGNIASCNGILGLGFKKLQRNPNQAILDSMVEQHLISEKMFSLYLKDSGTMGSFIIFGGIDKKFMRNPSEPFEMVPLIDDVTYSIHINGIRINDQLFSISKALVDSGTSCLTMPGRIMDDIKDSFNNDYHLDCSYKVEQYAPAYCMFNCVVNAITQEEIMAQFPMVYIQISETLSLSLLPQDYIYGCNVISTTQSKCYTKLERSAQDTIVLLGDAFLQSYYTIFDQSKGRLGFAHSINNGGIIVRQGLSVANSLASAIVVVQLVLLSILC